MAVIRLWVKHWNYFIDLPRWQVTYTLGRLLPGKPYYVKLLAKNVVGFTEYSDWNEATVENSHTAIEPPEVPGAPSVVAGTCCTLTIEFDLPFPNGSPITACYTQQREIGAFHKGPWEKDLEYKLNDANQVEIVNFVEPADAEFDVAMPSDGGKVGESAYNPFDRKKSKKHNKKLDTEKFSKYSDVSGPEYVLKVMKIVCANLIQINSLFFRNLMVRECDWSFGN